eukprot:CAMPEP_0170452010 /NCGR_PEP_ID=MMETSP0123-20130129/1060_1 /TAXON_ID=182087 /ORGANISM="Favella ehrenbergii, Strain Fehren 1" /LENGTH=68 /DNA_ID=CAMNT_0010713891 /DNA_START=1246 /DNA_END=1452 /DNA_ORIENTATION=+
MKVNDLPKQQGVVEILAQKGNTTPQDPTNDFEFGEKHLSDSVSTHFANDRFGGVGGGAAGGGPRSNRT